MHLTFCTDWRLDASHAGGFTFSFSACPASELDSELEMRVRGTATDESNVLGKRLAGDRAERHSRAEPRWLTNAHPPVALVKWNHHIPPSRIQVLCSNPGLDRFRQAFSEPLSALTVQGLAAGVNATKLSKLPAPDRQRAS